MNFNHVFVWNNPDAFCALSIQTASPLPIISALSSSSYVATKAWGVASGTRGEDSEEGAEVKSQVQQWDRWGVAVIIS